MKVTRDYKLFITIPGVIEYKDRIETLPEVMFNLLNKLKNLNALDCYNTGEFVQTQNSFTGDIVTKRYKVVVNIPYTIFEIRKMSRGSLNIEMFVEQLKYIKENYFEGI